MKKIIQIVIAVHIGLLLLMKVQKPLSKKPAPLKVRTVVLEAPKAPSPVQMAAQPVAQKQAPVKKTVSAPVKKPAPAPKKAVAKIEKPQISEALAKQLEENIAKIHQKSDKEWPKAVLRTPGLIRNLKIDLRSEGSQYEGELVGRLQRALDLPEIGEVEIELSLSSDGHFKEMKVIRSESNLNRTYLEKELQKVYFPPFTGELIAENTHTFTLTFCNR